VRSWRGDVVSRVMVIRDITERKKAEERKALEQVPASVTVTEAPDGGKNVMIEASVSLHIEVDTSGEIIRTYSLRIVDLVAAKKIYDLWKNYMDTLLETQMIFILILFAVFLQKRFRKVF